MRILLAAGILALFGCASSPLWADASAPRTFLVAPVQYVGMRDTLAAGSPPVWAGVAAAALRAAADKALTAGPWSVVDKPDRQIAPSGDKHDYVSMSSYWWPGADGVYEWRDGKINPDMVFPDEAALGDLMSALKTLAPAGYLLGDERCTARAVFLIDRWFLDPATRMNPNLNYAAGIPGKATGRGFGLHRMKEMPAFVDILGLLAVSSSWTPEREAGMRDWIGRYLAWATTSELGLDEKRQPNNHAVYYGAHALAAALYVDDKSLIEEFSRRYFQEQLVRQIKPDGELPAEMARSRPYNYTIYTLAGFATYAELARGLGLDYYHHKGPEGQTLAQAFRRITPFLAGEVAPPKPEEDMRLSRIFTVCRLGALRCDTPFFEDYLRRQFPRWAGEPRNLFWPPADPAAALGTQ